MSDLCRYYYRNHQTYGVTGESIGKMQMHYAVTGPGHSAQRAVDPGEVFKNTNMYVVIIYNSCRDKDQK
jgi:hypothetical protein